MNVQAEAFHSSPGRTVMLLRLAAGVNLCRRKEIHSSHDCLPPEREYNRWYRSSWVTFNLGSAVE